MKTLSLVASVALALALTGCTAPTGTPPFETPEAPAHVESGALIPPQTVDSCSGFQGSWGLLALRCPEGTEPQTGECHVFGGGTSLLASGLQGPDAWGCQATHVGTGSFSMCVTVICR